MRMSRWEKPEVAFANVAYEHLTVGTHHRYTGFSVQHVSPFVGSVPVEFAVTPGGQAHVDASDILRGRQFALGHLMGPTAFLHALLDQIERIPQRNHVSMIRRRWHVRIRIFIQEWFVFLTWITGRVVVFRCRRARSLLPAQRSCPC